MLRKIFKKPLVPIRPMVVIERRKTYWPHVLAVGLLWSVAMTMDYREQMLEAKAGEESMAGQMAECLNGQWRGVTPSGEQIGCMPAETLRPTDRSGK